MMRSRLQYNTRNELHFKEDDDEHYTQYFYNKLFNDTLWIISLNSKKLLEYRYKYKLFFNIQYILNLLNCI